MSGVINKLKLKLQQLKKQPAAVEAVGDPFFLMVGSLSGCTKKDALLYVRGLAESNVISPEAGRIYLYNDKPRNRWVYEIHEGGSDTSIAEKVIKAIEGGAQVRIALTNGAHVTIEESHGEIFSLVHPSAESSPGADSVQNSLQLNLLDPTAEPLADKGWSNVGAYAGSAKLDVLFPEDKLLQKVGLGVLSVSFICFVLAGATFAVLQSGLLDADSRHTLAKAGYTTDKLDNPAWQLEKARLEANRSGQLIKALKKGPTGWSWELGQ